MVTTNQHNQPKLTRPKQTADFFQISVMTLHRWRSEKDFPQPLKRGQVVLYDVAAIEAWLTCGEVAQ